MAVEIRAYPRVARSDLAIRTINQLSLFGSAYFAHALGLINTLCS